tara:strand:+ start:1392 stop:6893 length:5502 start_codon:yes stop_codon:yes gene_type:complete
MNNINKQEVNLTNGAPYEEPKVKENVSSNDAFYATVLSESEDPVNTYLEILRGAAEEGESSFMESLELKFQEEDNKQTQINIESMLLNPEITRENKRFQLEEYLYSNKIPPTIEERYVEDASLENIVDNNQELNEKINIEQQGFETEAVTESVWGNLYESLLENEEALPKKDFEENVKVLANMDIDAEANIEYWGKDSTLDKAISPVMNNVGFWANMLLGESWKWFVDITDSFGMYYNNVATVDEKTQLPQHKAALLLLSYLKKGTKSLDPKKRAQAQIELSKDESEYGKALNNMTSMFDYISRKNAGDYDMKDKTVSAEVGTMSRNFLSQMLGISTEDLASTISASGMESFDEFMQKTSEAINPDDPMLVRLPLELLIGIFGPKGVKQTYRAGKYVKNVAVVGRPGAQLIKNIEYTSLSTTQKVLVDSTPTLVQVGSKEVINKVNSPLATTMKVNKNKAGNLVLSTLDDSSGEIASVVMNNVKNPEFTSRKLIFWFSDSNQSMFNTNLKGWVLDSAVLRELQLISEINTVERYIPAGARDVSQRKVELNEIVSVINGIDSDIRIVPSRSFSVFEPTALGFEQNLVFRKDSRNDFTTLAEAKEATNAIKKSLEENTGDTASIIDSELTLVERNAEGNIVRKIKQKDFNKIKDLETNNTYRVEWKRDKELYNAFFGEMRKTPNERFSGGTNFVSRGFQGILRRLYNMNSDKNRGTFSDIYAKYGKYDIKLEDALFSQDLIKESYFKETLDRLSYQYKRQMDTKEQRQFAKLLAYSEDRFDTLTGGQINAILGDGNLTNAQVHKMQTAINSYRLVTNELHQARNLIERRILQSKGYNNSFNFINPLTKKNEVIPVKESFQFKWQNDFVGANEFSNARNQGMVPEGNFSYEVWDYNKGKAVLHRPLNQGKESTHFLQDGDGMPQQQIYSLAHRHLAPDGNHYNFAVFGTVKPGALPREISPRRVGYVPKMHPEAIVVKRYKLEFKNNGQVINYKNNRENVAKDLDAFSETIRLFVSKKDADAYVAKLDNNDYHYEVSTVRELDRRGQRYSDEQIQRQQLNTNSQRIEGLKYDVIDGDPYSSLVKTIQTTGASTLDLVNIQQLKSEFVKAVENNPNIKINRGDSKIEGLGRIEDRYPDRDMIQKVGDDTSTYNHFTALWDQLYIYEMGQARGSVANTVAWFGETIQKLSDSVAGDMGIGKIGIKGGVWLQRNPQAAAGAPLKPITSLWIMMRPVKQFILQSMASAGPIAVLSNGNPAQMFRIYSNSIRLMMMRRKNAKNMRQGKDGDNLSKAIDSYWNQTEGVITELGLPREKGSKFEKISNADLDFIDLYSRRTGTSNVRDHVFNQGIGINSIPSLGSAKGTALFQAGGGLALNKSLQYVNPLGHLNRASETMSKIGFEFGEAINRDLFTMVALENFKAKNKGANWKSDKNMNQIMLDANRLAGGMNKTMAYRWQSNVGLRYVGLFTSFSMKMSERTWNANATPFSGKQRAALLATDFLLYGSSLYGLEKLLRNSLLDSDNEDMKTWGQYFGRLNLSYQIANKFGGYLGTETGILPGESLSVHGNAPFGPLTNLYRMLASAQGDTFDLKELGATYAFYKKVLGENGAVDMILSLYSNSEHFTLKEKLHIIKSQIYSVIPFLNAADKVTFGILENKWLGDETKTGANTGLETTPKEQIFQTVLGSPNERTKYFWDILDKNRNKKKALRNEARKVIQLYRQSRNKAPSTIEGIKNLLLAWKFKLEEETLIANTAEHDFFMDQAMLMLSQQDKTFVEKFYTEFKKSFKYSYSYYSQSDLEQLKVLRESLIRQFPDSVAELDDMYDHMITANEAYKKENK